MPEPLRAILRGIGQVFFQGNAVTGICFLVAIAVSSPLMALDTLVGAGIGTGVAKAAKWDVGDRLRTARGEPDSGDHSAESLWLFRHAVAGDPHADRPRRERWRFWDRSHRWDRCSNATLRAR